MSQYMQAAEDVKQRLRPYGIFFEKSLKDLIRGIRSHNDTPDKLHAFLEGVLKECREEVGSMDVTLKTNAVLKMTYLEMYGFDMSWANFHILEVMSSSKIQQKRVGYLAASQSFYKDSDILMLATNLMKKDLQYKGSNDVVKVGIALSGLSTVITPSLAENVCDDLVLMLNSSKPYIRKKSLSALYKVFLEYPEALRDNFDKFTATLEDEDISVLSASVSVICELAKKNPAPFIPLSPLLYDLLINIQNNWIIIRLLKLFINLSKYEKKLRPKLLPKVLELMELTTATSVIYESINCIVRGELLDDDDYDTGLQCLDKLEGFCNSQDPNLRYISCGLFYKIGKINPEFIFKFSSLVIKLISDIDVSIRSKALELLEGIVDEDNIKHIVKELLKQFIHPIKYSIDNTKLPSNSQSISVPESYKIKVINVIIELCSMNNFENIPDFEWYDAVLLDLAILSQDLSDKSLGSTIGLQLKEIMLRVPAMRSNTIATIINVISNDDMDAQLPTIFKDTFWALGEYSSYIQNGDDLIKLFLLRADKYPVNTIPVLITAIIKIFSNWCNNSTTDLLQTKNLLEELLVFLENFSKSSHFETQERAIEASEFLRLCYESLDTDSSNLPALLSEILPSFFNAYEIKPIRADTQRKFQATINIDVETPFLTETELELLLQEDEYRNSTINEIQLSDDDSYDSDESVEYNDLYKDNISLQNNELGYSEIEKSGHKIIDAERIANPFYLTEEDSATKASKDKYLIDLDLPENNTTNSKFDIKTINVAELNDKVSIPNKKSKKKKHKIQVLADDDLFNDSNNDTSLKSTESKTKAHSTRKSKLENFDFTNPTQVNHEDDDEELQRLIKKFADQDISADIQTIPTTNNNDDVEEVIIIKKHKKKSKKKSKKKTTAIIEEEPEPLI